MTDEKIRTAVEIAQKAIELGHRVPPEGLKKSKELMTLAHAVVELAEKIKNERDKHFEDATFMAKMINSKTKKIYRLEADLAALKEKYRWRNVDEEEPPRETEVLICCVSRSGAHKYVYTASFDGEDFYDRRGDSPSGEVKFWRPLDLPEMGGAK